MAPKGRPTTKVTVLRSDRHPIPNAEKERNLRKKNGEQLAVVQQQAAKRKRGVKISPEQQFMADDAFALRLSKLESDLRFQTAQRQREQAENKRLKGEIRRMKGQVHRGGM